MMDKEKNGWVEVRDPYTGKLLCRWKREGLLLEIKRGSVTTTVDLRHYEEGQDDKQSSDK